MADPYLTKTERAAILALYHILTDGRRDVLESQVRDQRWWQWGPLHPWGRRARRRG